MKKIKLFFIINILIINIFISLGVQAKDFNVDDDIFIKIENIKIRINSLKIYLSIYSYLNQETLQIADNINKINKNHIIQLINIFELLSAHISNEIEISPQDKFYDNNLKNFIINLAKISPEIFTDQKEELKMHIFDTTEKSLACNPPIADAGQNVTILDSDLDGQELVVLDGSGSSTDVVSYKWSVNGTELGRGSVLSHKFPLGVHLITLTVTNNCGAIDKDAIYVKVESVL